MLSSKQIHQIKKDYPKKTVDQIADEFHLPPSKIYSALGLKQDLWAFMLQNTVWVMSVLMLLVAPLVFIRGLHDFADLPQRVFIQFMAVCLILVCALRAAIKRELIISRSPQYLITAAFIIWSFITLLWAKSIYEGFYSAIHITACGAIFYSLSTLPYNMKWVNRMLSAIIIAGTGVVLVGLAQQFFQLRWVPVSVSPAATFGNPNMAADYLTMVLPLMVALSLSHKNILVRSALLIIALLTIIFLFYTHSRGALLSLLCALTYMAFLYARRKYTITRQLIWVGSAIILIVGIVVIALSPTLRSTIEDTALSEYRLIPWRNCLEIIKDNPLRGVGAGNFKIFYPAYSHKAVVDLAYDATRTLGKAHNDYIQTAVELGLPGMLLFVLFSVCGLIVTYRILCGSNNSTIEFISIGISGGLISFMTGAFFSFHMQRSMPPLLLFVYLGILTILSGKVFPLRKMLKIRVSNTIGLLCILCLLITGLALTRFNGKNIICDGYYGNAMDMEKQKANSFALSAGLTAHNYNKYRMDVLTTVGRAYAATGELDQAISALEIVTQSHPFDLNALFILGVAYTNRDMNEKALGIFRRVLLLKPGFPEAQKIICLLNSRKTVRISLT
jgi:O-antigen ligase